MPKLLSGAFIVFALFAIAYFFLDQGSAVANRAWLVSLKGCAPFVGKGRPSDKTVVTAISKAMGREPSAVVENFHNGTNTSTLRTWVDNKSDNRFVVSFIEGHNYCYVAMQTNHETMLETITSSGSMTFLHQCWRKFQDHGEGLSQKATNKWYFRSEDDPSLFVVSVWEKGDDPGWQIIREKSSAKQRTFLRNMKKCRH